MAFDAVKNFVTGTTKAIGNAARAVANTAGNMVQTYAQVQPATYAWTGKSADQMNTLEKTAYLRSMGNKDAARNAFAALAQETQTVGSRHYSPYSTGKSNQKEAMAFFGLDSFDQNWLDENRFLLNYTNQLDLTDTISTSGQKNWSNAQWAGYYYSQLAEAEKTTQAAENEWAQLRGDMQRNFNEYKRLYGEAPSYDKLMSYIDMNDYSTLQKMDKVYSNVEDLVRLNRSVEYTPETMVGVYASLLNGKDVTQDGDYFEEAVQYTMKPLQRPQETPEKPDYSGWTNDQIEAKRQEIRRTGSRKDLAQFEADLYASTPHLDSVDSESYFADTYYDQAFLDKYAYLGEYAEQLRNRDGKIEKPAASDPWWYGAAYEYDQIRSREEDTRKAEEEWNALRKALTASWAEGDDVDILLEDMNWDKYPTLKKLREGKDVDLNRPVYFSDEAIKGVLQAHVDGQDINNDDFDYAFYQTPAATPDEEKPFKVTVDQSNGSLEVDDGPISTYFAGPSAYDGKIEGIDYDDVPEEEKAQDHNIDAGSSGLPRLNPGEFYEFNPDAYFSGPAQTPEAIAADEQQKVEAEQRKEERQSFMDNLWQDMTANTKIDATMIEKQFYEANGRPMTQEERIRSGLAPLGMESFDPSQLQLGAMEQEKQSIFDDTYNSIAQRYDYENMDQLIANDPALLSNMIDYVEAKPVNEEFSTTEVEHLKLLKQYQDDLDNGTLDEMFRAYADANGTDEAKLNGAINYIIESGLTLEEKGALGLLENGEDTQLVAERADELFGQHGGEMARAMAISLLGTDADEGALKVMEAAISHLFAVETGVAGGLLGSQMIGYNAARDLWSAIAAPMYEARLGEGYTLDQACEIDPLLRGLTAAVDKGNAITRIASPDMSSFNYGAEFTQFITKSAIDQKMAAFYAPVGQNFANSMFKKLGLGDLPEMLAADKKFSKAFELIGKTSNSMPWMLRSMSESAQEARDMGAGERDAIKFGLFNAGTTGLIEGFIGQAYDGLLGKGSNVLTKGLSKLTKGGMDKFLAKNGVIKTMNVLQQAFSESLEEMAEAPLDKMGRMNILNQTAEEAGGDVKETWDNMKLSFVSSLFTSAFFGLSADQNTKLYTDSEKVLERIMNGEASVDEMMEYAMTETEAASSSSNLPVFIPGMAEEGYVSPEVRDSVRIMHENQAALDNAAIDMAAEDVVQQQINEGAMDDLIGPASPNAKTIAMHEVNLQTLLQKAQHEAEQMEQIDAQKEAAIYNIISNGLSPKNGAARQTVHNFDEMKAAAQKRYDEWNQKLMDEEATLQLEREHIQAQVEQRHKEMMTAARVDVQQRWEQAKQKADQLVIEMDSQKDTIERPNQSVEVKPELAEGSLADQIIGVETGEDSYDYFSAKEKSGESVSQAEANRIAHHAGTDIQPDVELDSGEGDGFWKVDRKQLAEYRELIRDFVSHGWSFDEDTLFKTEWDGDNRVDDPIAGITNRALVTVAKTEDDEYVLVKDTERANQEGSGGAYILLKRPDFTPNGSSAIDKEAQHIMDAMDVRLNELDSQPDQKHRADALRKLRKEASSYMLSGRQRALVDKLNNLISKEDDNRIGTQELRRILESIPQNEESSFSLDDYVVGRYGKQNDAILDITRMGKKARLVSRGKPTIRISLDLMNAIPNPRAFMRRMEYDDFNIEEFAAANPKLFGKVETEGETWKPENLSFRYDSKLAHDNPNYSVLDNSNGFNLVVKSNRIQLDPNNTGRLEQVNLDIHTVSDAVQAIQKQLINAQKSMKIEAAKGNKKDHDPMRLIYTVYDQNGQPVNKTYQDYVDPKTGQQRIPTVRELLAVSSRITVNWPRKWVQLGEGGKWVVGEKLEFTLERSDLAPNAYDPRDPNASKILVQAELRRAESEYEEHIGNSSSAGKLRYFVKVCESNINSYLQAINQLSDKIESGNITDAELATARQNMIECYEALQTWQYAADRVTEVQDAQSNEHSVQIGADKLMKVYEGVLKKIGHASLEARLELAGKFKNAMNALYVNDLMASMPAGATLETLAARHQELQSMLEEVMNARNQAAVLNHRFPSHLNNEPLAEAIMEEQDTVRNQLMIIENEPDFFSSLHQQHPASQEQASDIADDTVEAPASEQAENAAEKPTEELSQNAENEQIEGPEEADTVQKKQKMDRTYLGAIIDAETGEEVSSTEELTGSEYVDAETGEFKNAHPDVHAEDLSYAAPVEEYMERAGLERNYPSVNITDVKSHGQVEQMADTAFKTVKVLTDRIDTIQTTLQSGVPDEEQASAIQAEKQRYIDERNRIKAEAKRMDAKLSSSNYYSEQTVRNIAVHCLETGEVDWEAPEARARQINEIYQNDLSRMKHTLQSKLVAGRTTALTLDDVAEIIGTPELERELNLRHDVGFELSRRLHRLEEALEWQQELYDDVVARIEQSGATTELEAERGRIDGEIKSLQSKIENGQKAMRMYFDSGSNLTISQILRGEGGGKLPLNIMNRIYAILKDIDAKSKNTNRSFSALAHAKNPMQAIEDFTGEWSPLFNAIYIAQVQPANAAMRSHEGDIIRKMQNSGLKHSESADAMRYAEGKMTEEEFETLYPDDADRRRIKRAVTEYQDIYESLFNEVNDALMRNGFDPIPHRKNYIHHMRDVESGIGKACSLLGIHISDDDLPTALAGHTDETKPRRGFMAAQMERKGDDTVYDIERNTEAYVRAAMRVIYHTDNITRLRQLEGIMDQTVNKRPVNSGLAQYSEVVDTNDLKRSGRNVKTVFSSMREWVTEYTNLLAGKQSFVDRPAEALIGRKGLQIANGLKNLVGQSIVVGNLNIATSNILPVMTMAGISPAQTAASIADIVRGGADGMRAFEMQSDFLTSRFVGQKFEYNWMDAASDKAMIPFEAIDRFAANVAVRTYQKIGLKKGWSPEVAMKWADQMAMRMMASTNPGEGANIMASKTAGIFLQFSREGINNLQFLMHDLPEISNGGGDLLKKLLGILIGGWLYNAAFNKTTALEPITPTMQSIREWDSDKTVLENLGNAAGNYAEMLNPTNLGTGSDLNDIPLFSRVGDIGKAAFDIGVGLEKGEGVRDGLTDLFTATLGFIPGGLSIERLLTGIEPYYRGYSTDSAGNIKFTIDNDLFSVGSIHDAIFMLLLSPSGTKGGREYTRNGYKAMTKTQTAAFHSEKATGMSNQEAYNSVMGHAEQKGNNNASDMVLPDWAAAEADSDWMQAVREFGVGAYPREAPEEMTINGVERKLTDEEKEAFVKRYKQTYRMYIVDAMNDGSNLHNAAESAYNKAYSNFRKGLED